MLKSCFEKVGTQFKHISIFCFALAIFTFSCKSSETIYLESSVSAPSIAYVENSAPDTLMINFDGSAAKLEDIGKEPSGKITI